MNVYELTAKILLDDKEYKKGLKDSEKSTKSWGEKLKGGFKRLSALAAKATVAGVSAAATGLTVLLKKSVQAYGEYEQLVGGVQKIFDQANIAKIMEDANNAYIDLNMSANQYLATINQTGAAFAQTMGDQKGYDVARKGMKAIADYASGTGRNLEELNEKYSLITRSTSSYQSIADQFSGILPATSAAFLEQAQAAGFLSDSYTSLTEVPINEYQEAVTNMLEKGVDAMGLLGNTAAESTETLTGSFAMARAAWDNLVTGLTNPDADIGQLITNFVDAAKAALENLVPAVKTALKGISQLVEGLAPILSEELPKLIKDTLPALLAAAVDLVSALIDALPAIISAIADVVPLIITTIVDAIVRNIEPLIEAAAVLIDALIEGIIAALPVIVDHAPEIVAALIRGILASDVALVEGAGMIIKTLVMGLIEKAQEMFEAGKNLAEQLKNGVSPFELAMEIINGIIEGVASLFKPFGDTGYKNGKEFGEKLKKGIHDKIEAVRAKIEEIKQTIIKKIQEIIVQAPLLGASIIGGFASALGTGISIVGGIIMGIVNTILSPFRGLISTVRSVGRTIISGFSGGLGSGIGAIAGIMSSIVSTVTRPITNLISRARTWGSHLVSGFASGIRSGIGLVTSAATAISSGVKKIFGHSHPEEGPMADDYTWMPDMMKLFAKGIKDNAHLVTSAAEDAFNLGDIVTGGFSGASVSTTGTKSSGIVMTFNDAVEAFKIALQDVAVELDDDEVGSFVRRTVVKSVYA